MDSLNQNNIAALKASLLCSRTRILADHPFFGYILVNMNFIFTDEDSKMSTDGTNIYINPTYFMHLKDEEIDICILHELMHIILKHPFRYQKSMDNKFFHYAADIVANSNIMESANFKGEELYVQGKKLPHLTPNGKEGREFTVEEVYLMLVKKGEAAVDDLYGDEKETDDGEDDDIDQINQNDVDDIYSVNIAKNVTPVIKVKGDYSGHLYLREVSGFNYIFNDGWDGNGNCYSTDDFNPFLLVDNKVKQLCNKTKNIEVEFLPNYQDLLAAPYYAEDSWSFYENDVSTTPLPSSRHITYDFIPFKTTFERLQDIIKTKFDNPDYVDAEKSYRKLVHADYLDVPNIFSLVCSQIIKSEHFNKKDPDIIYKVRNYIASEYKYNAQFEEPPQGQDRILHFMKKSKEGVCYDFASAAVLLYRELGIPARFVIGFLKRVNKNIDNVIYQEESHAWVEVYVDGTGWVSIDPTPITSNPDSGSGNNGGSTEEGSESSSSKGNKGNTSDDNGNKKKESGNNFDNHKRWEELANDESLSQQTEDLLNTRLVQAEEIHNSSKGRGTIPGGAVMELHALKDPVIDWRVVLNDFVQEYVVDYSFTPPDKRMQDSEFIMPDFNDTDFEIKNILFMVDDSGSMSDSDITDCASEIAGALSQFNGKLKGFVGFFDTQVNNVYELDETTDVAKLRPIGRGGTDFMAVFNYLKKMDELPASIIILSDGYAPFPSEKLALGVPVLWIINNKEVNPPWGKVIRLIR